MPLRSTVLLTGARAATLPNLRCMSSPARRDDDPASFPDVLETLWEVKRKVVPSSFAAGFSQCGGCIACLRLCTCS